MFWIGLLIGLVLGSWLCIIFLAILTMSKDNEENKNAGECSNESGDKK